MEGKITEVICGFEGEVDKFIERAKDVWEKQGSKERGASSRYQIIIGLKNDRAAFVPTVTTRAGIQSLIIWNLSQEGIKKIKTEAKGAGIPVSEVPYLWFEAPTVLPNESKEETQETKTI